MLRVCQIQKPKTFTQNGTSVEYELGLSLVATLFYIGKREVVSMSKTVHWTDDTLRFFIEKALLTEDEIFILTTRLKGWSITKQSLEMGKSERTVSRLVKSIRVKYDVIQKQYPNEMPLRNVNSKTDKYLDTH